jgi:deoxyribodipyrimidine photo-lyase
MIQPGRIHALSGAPVQSGDYVMYWMQQSQRAECNHALEYAIEKANEQHKPLLVFFGLAGHYPDANLRHYRFMLEGLRETARALRERGIQMVVQRCTPPDGAAKFGRKATMVITDMGYLKIQRQWRRMVSRKLPCPVIEVESDVVVPVGEASQKEEFTAATLRPKISKLLRKYVVPLKSQAVAVTGPAVAAESLDLESIDDILKKMKFHTSVGPVSWIQGGTSEARKRLEAFLQNKLDHFSDLRNDPSVDYQSNLSPYLHFGQISPLYVALEVKKSRSTQVKPFLEELIVRRELAMNFVCYNDSYDSFDCLPDWAHKALIQHLRDRREHSYLDQELENAQTHDPYWNAAQKELLLVTNIRVLRISLYESR